MANIIGKLSSGSFLEIDEATRSRHMYIIGATGSGKTTFIEQTVLEDIANGHGACLIDFHSDLSRKIADTIPEERVNDVILFSPLDPTHVCTINPLLDAPPMKHNLIARQIIAALKDIWRDAWGPRLEYILYNTLRLLLENPGTTLVEIPQLLVDDRFRAGLLRNCKDRYVRAFWEDEYARWNDRFRAEAIASLQNKAGVFTNPVLRPILGRSATLNMRKIIDEKKILLCDFSKAQLGDDDARILASFVVMLMYQAALSRADLPLDDRHLYRFTIDEFQNCATDAADTMLSEVRKYGLTLTLAHQHAEQLPPKLLSAALANAATKVIFRVAATDAVILGSAIGTHPDNLSRQPSYGARVSIDAGQPHVVGFDPPCEPRGTYPRVLAQMRNRYALPR